MERKNLRNRVLAAILAGTMGLPLAACDKEKIREEYEKEKQEVYGDFDEKLEQQKDEIVKSILAELQGTTMPETTVTTTYTTESTNTTSTTNTTTKIQTTEQTSQTSTTLTTNNTTTQPTTTTTTKTTTVSFNNEPTMVDWDESFNPENNYLISNEYTVKDTYKGIGETLYSVVSKLNGRYDPKITDEIMKLNGLSETVALKKQKSDDKDLEVPYTLVYCKGRSAELIANLAGVPLDNVKKLNEIEDTKEMYPEEKYLLVKVLDKNQKTYKTINGETQNIIGGTVIKGNTVIECKNTYRDDSVCGVLSLEKTENNENIVKYSELKNDGSYIGCVVAENANYIKSIDGYPVIVCNNESAMSAKHTAYSKKSEEDYRTIIPKQFFTNEYYMYKSDDGTVAVAFSNIDIPGFKQYNVIGGKQKTIG